MNFEFDMTRKSIPQGDMYLIPIKAVPHDAEQVSAVNGHFIITHSETGHNHIIEERPDIRQFSGMDMFRGFLEVGFGADLKHLRHHHTHETQHVPAGAWLIQRQAAYTPKGWERARD